METGDRVMCNDNGHAGTVIESYLQDEIGCVVQFDDGEETWIEYECLTKIDAEVWKEKIE